MVRGAIQWESQVDQVARLLLKLIYRLKADLKKLLDKVDPSKRTAQPCVNLEVARSRPTGGLEGKPGRKRNVEW